MGNHINFINNKILKSLDILHRVRFLIKQKSRKKVYFSFAHSSINYGNINYEKFLQNQIEENIHLSEKKQLE